MENQNIEQKLENSQKELDNFENKLALPDKFSIEIENQAKHLLTISPAYLRKMGPEELSEGAYTLSQYAFFLQKAINKEISCVKWCDESIKRILSREIPQQRAYSYDERRMLAIKENDATQKIDELRVKSQLKIDRLNYVSMRVENLAQSMRYIKREK